MMIIKLTMAKITTNQLDDKCLAIIDKFSQQLREHNGTVINKNDECIVKQMMVHTKISRCAELQSLYNQFKHALTSHLESPEFDLAHTLNDELLHAVQGSLTNSALSQGY